MQHPFLVRPTGQCSAGNAPHPWYSIQENRYLTIEADRTLASQGHGCFTKECESISATAVTPEGAPPTLAKSRAFLKQNRDAGGGHVGLDIWPCKATCECKITRRDASMCLPYLPILLS